MEWIICVAAVFIAYWYFSTRAKDRRMFRMHQQLVKELNHDEAVYALHEAIQTLSYRYYWGASYMGGVSPSAEIYKYVQTATTLYAHILELEGKPISLMEKAKYRTALTSASIIRPKEDAISRGHRLARFFAFTAPSKKASPGRADHVMADLLAAVET